IAEQQRIAAEQQAAQKQAEQKKIAEQQAALKAEQERLAAEDEALKKEEKPKTVEAEKPAIKLTGKYFDSKTEEAVIRKINRERESLGLSALEYDENLQTAARLRSKELCQAGKFEHKRPTGEAWNTVIENDIPTDYTSVGENLAMADSNRPIDRTAEEWFRQWKESPSHYETMIVPEFEYIGVGIYTKEINGRYYSYATTLFGGY
ncbi:MAG: CAP domain-containing protein, partial [Oscillospiraceae bacterium]